MYQLVSTRGKKNFLTIPSSAAWQVNHIMPPPKKKKPTDFSKTSRKKKNKTKPHHLQIPGQHLLCTLCFSHFTYILQYPRRMLQTWKVLPKQFLSSFLGDSELGTTTSSLYFLPCFLCRSLIRSRIPFILLGLHCLENHSLESETYVWVSCLEHPELQQGSPCSLQAASYVFALGCARRLASEHPYSVNYLSTGWPGH